MNIYFVLHEDWRYSEHLGIMSLSSILRMAGHKVDIVEAQCDRIIKRVKNNNFAILAYSANSLNIGYYLSLNRKLKKEVNALSLFGGPHPTHFPEIINEAGVDGVCIGEGDYALLDLVNNLAEDKPITQIANWWIKHDGRIFRSPSRPLINNLDSLPFADRTLFPHHRAISIMTSRGCVFKCAYCQHRVEFRRRSVENVIEELRGVKARTNARTVYFSDSIFNVSLPWLRDFSEKYRKEINLPFNCYVHANLVTPESMEYLKEAGCFSVGMSIETANDYLRNEVLKKGISKEQIISAVQIIKRNKIKLKTSNLIGIPLGSLKDDLDTLRFNIQCGSKYATALPLFIHRNTDIYRFLIKNPRFKNRFKHLEMSPQDNLYIYWEKGGNIEEMREILNLYKLFSWVASLPFLFPLLPFLIKLPLSRIYTILWILWYRGYLHFFFWGGNFRDLRKSIIGMKKYLKIILRVLIKGI